MSDPSQPRPPQPEPLNTLADLRHFLTENLPDGQGRILHLFDEAVQALAARAALGGATVVTTPDLAGAIGHLDGAHNHNADPVCGICGVGLRIWPAARLTPEATER